MDSGGGWVREDPKGVKGTRMDLIKYGVNMYEILKEQIKTSLKIVNPFKKYHSHTCTFGTGHSFLSSLNEK